MRLGVRLAEYTFAESLFENDVFNFKLLQGVVS
jgi:hypothetical protein